MQEIIKLSQLTITIIVINEDTVKYYFKGEIAEQFSHTQVVIKPHRNVIFKLEDVNYISSVGIREWIMVVNKFSNQKVVFTKCSIYFVDQMNMVPDCLGKARVQSFYAPYYRDCDDCDGEKKCLIDLSNCTDPIKNLPVNKCKECNEELEFDALEESYFSFLNHQKV